MVSIPNPPAIHIRRQSRNPYQFEIPAQLLLGEALQLLADALPLIVTVNHEIR